MRRAVLVCLLGCLIPGCAAVPKIPVTPKLEASEEAAIQVLERALEKVPSNPEKRAYLYDFYKARWMDQRCFFAMDHSRNSKWMRYYFMRLGASEAYDLMTAAETATLPNRDMSWYTMWGALIGTGLGFAAVAYHDNGTDQHSFEQADPGHSTIPTGPGGLAVVAFGGLGAGLGPLFVKFFNWSAGRRATEDTLAKRREAVESFNRYLKSRLKL